MVTKITKSSGNVFRDLGFSEEDAQDLTLRSILIETIQSIIKKRDMSQAEVVAKLKIDQPRASRLLSGRIASFSVEKLTKFLLDLHCDIHIEFKEAPKNQARGRVVAAACLGGGE